MSTRSVTDSAQSSTTWLTPQLRPLLALLLSWGCCAALLAKVGTPATPIAGLLLSFALPGWLIAESALGTAGAAPERWATMIIGGSICSALAIGTLAAATGDLRRDTLASGWLALTSILGFITLIGRRRSEARPSLISQSAAIPAPSPDMPENTTSPSPGEPVVVAGRHAPAESGPGGQPDLDAMPAFNAELHLGAQPRPELDWPDAPVESDLNDQPQLDAPASASHAPTQADEDDRLAISVVICAYTQDRWLELVAAVDSLRSQTVAPADVVVVIDNSSDLLGRAQRDLANATIVSNTQRPGLAGARNCGVMETATEVVAFLDDDARAAPSWIAELISAYSDPNVMGVGGRIDPDWRVERPPWFPEEFNWVVGCSYRGLPTSPSRVRNLIGANMSMRRSVFDQVGGFRQELGRLEETDFCIRAQRAQPGGVWLYWPNARVMHSVSGERATWGFFTARCYNEGAAKASMVALTGRQDGLESERNYVRQVLPLGIAREFARVLRLDIGGPSRAMAIAAGLSYTVAGYALGWLRQRLRRSRGPVHIPRRGNTP